MGTVKAMERAMDIGAETRPWTSMPSPTFTASWQSCRRSTESPARFERRQAGSAAALLPMLEYVGPPHELVRPLLGDLCRFMSRDDISPIPQAAMAHAQFELIHPFGDGNGRVGRCLIHVLFRRRGVAPIYVPPVSLVLGANKDAYIAGLRNFRAQKVDQWVAQFSRAVETAALHAREFSSQVETVQDKWRKLVGPVRKDAAVMPLIDVLPKYPVITAGVAKEELGRSRPATIGALSRLEDAGVLKRRRNQKKGDSWEAPHLFLLLNKFEEAARAQPTATAVDR